jgi:hypothetical protein
LRHCLVIRCAPWQNKQKTTENKNSAKHPFVPSYLTRRISFFTICDVLAQCLCRLRDAPAEMSTKPGDPNQAENESRLRFVLAFPLLSACCPARVGGSEGDIFAPTRPCHREPSHGLFAVVASFRASDNSVTRPLPHGTEWGIPASRRQDSTFQLTDQSPLFFQPDWHCPTLPLL